jgi:hypothetical protein
MATSGTISSTTVTVGSLIDDAYARCKIMPQGISAEMLQRAEKQLHLFLSSLPSRVTLLWAQDRKLLGLPFGQEAITTPSGTIDVRKDGLLLRTLTRHSGTAVSSSGGTAANCLDSDTSTTLTQTSANGTIVIELDEESTVTTVGIIMNASGSYTLTFQTSDDGTTYTTRAAPGATTYVAGVPQWYELDPSIDCSYVRVTASGGGTLDVREFIAANTATDLPLMRIPEDNYIVLPNRATRGRPSMYWVDRQYDAPVLHLWPTADTDYVFCPLILNRQRHVMDVGDLTGTLEVPQRWLEALETGLALRLARVTPQVNPALLADLSVAASDAMMVAASDERDASPVTIGVDLTGYR